jgi:deazaflavin-dependent oxidoreductase (nitroreductase family)
VESLSAAGCRSTPIAGRPAATNCSTATQSAGEPDSSGWLTTTVPIESIRHGHTELLKLGADAEVLGPPELRDMLARTARGLAATYLDGSAGKNVDMTMPDDMREHNRQLIEQFRADGGVSMGNRPLVLLTTVGRRTGMPRTTPMMYVRDGDRLFVIASNAGAPEDPQWYRNLIADPSVTAELPGQELKARATPLEGADYDRTWEMIKERYPFFAEHDQRAGRRIPVVELIKQD